ncbi:chromatin remodelling complex Rsc7/Swp82 subunit-domain-containing protein [Gilbertella persicaria]|uniref:chromatin remodelling complex Rsc7/Swp82 subunit-domain-containing protein n=1 Tax=Gilbertella persicaria TaxID=101096 RepID=UPI00221FF0A4|nr:chromatin remodelling complex Rsc7/Swp82 subunit-domain-containing protein [Gilbertella persicaria]KAI8078091.1 chromatin remodelling complex Rsc7/Swp82 subunit-domain-containing protein [Gilbertella persicaria]
MPKRKRSRSQSGGLDRKDDLNYVDEDSELSSGDDALNTSDLESHHPSPDHHVRKRGRPKSHHYGSREDRHARSQQSSASSNLSNHSYHPPTTPSGYISDIDESGETKVDKYGRLLGGREYRVPTFTLPTRDNTLFMFSKDPAALLGFRDSFVFLKKNVKLIKVHIDNAEKGYLVDSNLLRSTFRTREISVVTARSVFKQFGHRIIRKGHEVDEGEDEPSDEEPPKDMLDKPVPASSFLPANLEVGRNNLIHQLTAQDTTTTELNWLHHAAVSTRQQTLRNTEEKTNTLNSDIPMDFNLAMMNHPKMELNFNHI